MYRRDVLAIYRHCIGSGGLGLDTKQKSQQGSDCQISKKKHEALDNTSIFIADQSKAPIDVIMLSLEDLCVKSSLRVLLSSREKTNTNQNDKLLY